MVNEMAEKIKNFKDLKIWQKGMELAKMIYKLTGFFPSEEKYGIANQMKRAAVSTPSNIAEGFMRKHMPLACPDAGSMVMMLLRSIWRPRRQSLPVVVVLDPFCWSA